MTKENDSKTFLGWKGYSQLNFQVAGQSLESHSLRASLHAAGRSLPLGPSVLTAVLWASLHSPPTQPSSGLLSLALPPLQPLLCSPAALEPCHRDAPRALGGALFIESTAMYCPQVCSELVSHGQVRILATGTLILCTLPTLAPLHPGLVTLCWQVCLNTCTCTRGLNEVSVGLRQTCDVCGFSTDSYVPNVLLTSPTGVYRADDPYWTWRCDFSWVTQNSCLAKPREPQSRVLWPWGVAAFTREQLSETSNSRSCRLPSGLHTCSVIPGGTVCTNREGLSCLDSPAKPAQCPKHRGWHQGLGCRSHLPNLVSPLSW